MPDFLLPDLGEGLDEAEVVAWHVQVGEHVTVDQVIAEVETAKAVVEVPVPFAGIVTKLHAEPGATVSVGQPLISVIGGEDAAGLREPGVVTPAASAGGTAAGAGRPRPRAGRGAERQRADRLRHEQRARPQAARPPPRCPPAPDPGAGAAAPAAPAGSDRGPVAVISPLVRKLARDAGLDLARLPGSGPAGLITHADVRRAIAARAGATASAEPAPPAAPAPPVPSPRPRPSRNRPPRPDRGSGASRSAAPAGPRPTC